MFDCLPKYDVFDKELDPWAAVTNVWVTTAICCCSEAEDNNQPISCCFPIWDFSVLLLAKLPDSRISDGNLTCNRSRLSLNSPALLAISSLSVISMIWMRVVCWSSSSSIDVPR